MMKRTFTIGSLAFLVFFVAGFWAGCMIEYDDQLEDVYACESDKDCIQPAFICSKEKQLCVRHRPNVAPPCVDEDGDGYGVGEDRSLCDYPEPDCDDSDASVYPGAPEICDGKLNDCNATEIDVAPCGPAANGKPAITCPTQQKDPEGHTIKYSCEANRCVAKSPKEICPGNPCPECLEPIQCIDGVLGIVPEACR